MLCLFGGERGRRGVRNGLLLRRGEGALVILGRRGGRRVLLLISGLLVHWSIRIGMELLRIRGLLKGRRGIGRGRIGRGRIGWLSIGLISRLLERNAATG